MGKQSYAFLWLGCETCFLIMKRVRNVFPNSDYRGRNVFLIRGRNVFLIRGRNVFPKYEEGGNVFPKYDLEAKRLSEIWFGCETSFWNMVWVRNVFLRFGLGAKRLPELWRRVRNVFPIYGVGGNVSLKKWCELTMRRKVCVSCWTDVGPAS